jgi:hypothetical protein
MGGAHIELRAYGQGCIEFGGGGHLRSFRAIQNAADAIRTGLDFESFR